MGKLKFSEGNMNGGKEKMLKEHSGCRSTLMVKGDIGWQRQKMLRKQNRSKGRVNVGEQNGSSHRKEMPVVLIAS